MNAKEFLSQYQTSGKEIIENNKLITEFMGNTIRGNTVYFPMLQECKVDELEYDSSYDWLMSVVDFIEELGSYSIMGKKSVPVYIRIMRRF